MIVYKITHASSGKAYIGATTATLHGRWWSHLSAARRGDNRPLYHALREHGAKAFTLAQLRVCTSLIELADAERRFIIQHRTLEPQGFNIRPGGGALGCVRSSEGRRRIAAAAKQRTNTPTWKRRTASMGLANRGRRLTPEQRAALHAVQTAPLHLAKLSAAHGIGAVRYAGTTYPSLAALARAHGRSKQWAETRHRKGEAVPIGK
jgi:hypothetical protein